MLKSMMLSMDCVQYEDERDPMNRGVVWDCPVGVQDIFQNILTTLFRGIIS